MKYDDKILQYEQKLGIPFGEVFNIIDGVSHVFPMIIFANLSKNTYSMIRNDNFLAHDVMTYGRYDDMIDDGIENIHPNYQETFMKCFSRENLIKTLESGKTDVYAELYQKNKEGSYHWVSTHVIRVFDDSGDIVEICLNRVLDGIVEGEGGLRK